MIEGYAVFGIDELVQMLEQGKRVHVSEALYREHVSGTTPALEHISALNSGAVSRGAGTRAGGTAPVRFLHDRDIGPEIDFRWLRSDLHRSG